METYTGLMKDIQKENVAGMKESCGMITAEGLPKCRMGCQTNHGDNMVMWRGFRNAAWVARPTTGTTWSCGGASEMPHGLPDQPRGQHGHAEGLPKCRMGCQT